MEKKVVSNSGLTIGSCGPVLSEVGFVGVHGAETIVSREFRRI